MGKHVLGKGKTNRCPVWQICNAVAGVGKSDVPSENR